MDRTISTTADRSEDTLACNTNKTPTNISRKQCRHGRGHAPYILACRINAPVEKLCKVVCWLVGISRHINLFFAAYKKYLITPFLSAIRLYAVTSALPKIPLPQKTVTGHVHGHIIIIFIIIIYLPKVSSNNEQHSRETIGPDSGQWGNIRVALITGRKN